VMSDREEKFLAIAQMLSQGVHVSDICKKLKVSGKTVGDVKKMMDAGMIIIDPNGDARFNTTLGEVDAFLEEIRERRPVSTSP